MNPHFNSFDELLGITLSASSNILHNIVSNSAGCTVCACMCVCGLQNDKHYKLYMRIVNSSVVIVTASNWHHPLPTRLAQ